MIDFGSGFLIASVFCFGIVPFFVLVRLFYYMGSYFKAKSHNNF